MTTKATYGEIIQILKDLLKVEERESKVLHEIDEECRVPFEETANTKALFERLERVRNIARRALHDEA